MGAGLAVEVVIIDKLGFYIIQHHFCLKVEFQALSHWVTSLCCRHSVWSLQPPTKMRTLQMLLFSQ